MDNSGATEAGNRPPRQSASSVPTTNIKVATQEPVNGDQVRDFILLTPYPVEPGHTLITIMRLAASDWRPEMRLNAAHVAEGDNAGIVINKPASIMDYNKARAGQKERLEPPSAKMSFKVFLINSETGKLTLEHRTLRFWLNQSSVTPCATNDNNYVRQNNNTSNSDNENHKSARTFANIRQESSQLAQAYFRQLIGSKPDDDFPKNYVAFLMKLMRLLKTSQFDRLTKMEVELRQLAHEDHTEPPSRASSLDGSQSGSDGNGRGSPLTSQKVLDIIESSYPNPISVKEICSTINTTEESIVKQFVVELASKEKINSTDDGQHYTRTTKPIDTKVNLVKQMPKVNKSQQPVIAILTAQYCEKLAVDSMISDKETFVRYRTTTTSQQQQQQNNHTGSSEPSSSSANYVYTLGNIGDHRVVSTKLSSIGHSRGALIAAGNATTRLLGTFPELEYVFLVGCGGGVVNYTDFGSHVRLGDVVISHLAGSDTSDGGDISPTGGGGGGGSNPKAAAFSPSDHVYVHCRPKLQDTQKASNTSNANNTNRATIPVSYSVHKNLKRAASNGFASPDSLKAPEEARGGQGDEDKQQDEIVAAAAAAASKPLEYEECHFRLWRPARLDLQRLSQRLWLQGLEDAKHRIWEYYIDEGIKTLRQQDIEASRPPADTDKLYMSIGLKDTIEVSHPEANEDELDLRRLGRPMCHFGPIGSGRPAGQNEALKQRMISEFGLRAFDSEFDPVVESIYGNCKECYVMIRGVSDYKDGRKKKEWQQYSALVAAAFMKSIIVNLKPLN